MSKQLKSDQQEPCYADVVHHANVKASLSYVARKTGLTYPEAENLLELALKRGDLSRGDYEGRRLVNYVDDKTNALQARIAELEAQLVAEAARTAEQKLRADQMTKQHDTQAALNREARNQLAQLTSQLEAIGAGGVESLRKKGNA